MKTQDTNLKFAKNSIVELNNNELLLIKGGTTGGLCDAAVAVIKASSQGCADAAVDALVDVVQNITNAE